VPSAVKYRTRYKRSDETGIS